MLRFIPPQHNANDPNAGRGLVTEEKVDDSDLYMM